MAVDYRSSTITRSTSSTFTANKPTGVVSGDGLVAYIVTNASGSAHALSGGSTWTKLSSGTPSTGYSLWSKNAGGSEPASYNVTATTGAADEALVLIVAASDAGTATPVFSVTTNAGTAGSPHVVSTPGVTPPDAASLEIRFASVVGVISIVDFVAPAGLTERQDANSLIGSDDQGAAVATRLLTSGSATSALNFTVNATSISGSTGIGVTVSIGSNAIAVNPSSIASGEAWGTASLGLNISPSAIASAESFGSASVIQNITLAGIASLEAWGTTVVDAGLRPSSIASEEAWGTPGVIRQQPINLTAIASAEAWGTASLQIGYPITLTLQSIPSEEAVSTGLVVDLLSHYVLRNPSIQETPAALSRPFNRFGIHRGISIIRRHDGSYYSSRYPAQTELEEAAAFYLGGRLHAISPEVQAELVAAGYGAYITLAENDQ